MWQMWPPSRTTDRITIFLKPYSMIFNNIQLTLYLESSQMTVLWKYHVQQLQFSITGVFFHGSFFLIFRCFRLNSDIHIGLTSLDLFFSSKPNRRNYHDYQLGTSTAPMYFSIPYLLNIMINTTFIHLK